MPLLSRYLPHSLTKHPSPRVFAQLASVHEDLSLMQEDLEELETQRLESDRERSMLRAQLDETRIHQETLSQQKVRLQQEKFVIQVLKSKNRTRVGSNIGT